MVAFQIPVLLGYGGIEENPVPMIVEEFEVPFQIPVVVGCGGNEEDPVPTIEIAVDVPFQMPVLVRCEGVKDTVPLFTLVLEVPFQIPVLLYDGIGDEPVMIGAVGPTVKVELCIPAMLAEVDVRGEVFSVVNGTDRDEDVEKEETVEEVNVAGFAHSWSVSWLLTTAANGLLSIRFCSE